MATIDDVYALLQTVEGKVDSLTAVGSELQNRTEFILAMLAVLSPFFASGEKFYVDGTPGVGNDGYDGSSEFPFATIARAVTACVDGRHDVIMVRQKATAYAECVVINKTAVMLLLSGNGCKLDPGAAAADDTIKITAADCVVLGGGDIIGRNGHRAVYAYNADGIVLQHSICRTDGSADIDAVVIEECLVPKLGPELSCSHCDGHGLLITSVTKACHWAILDGITSHQCGKDGIHLEGNVDSAIISNCHSHNNEGYGMYLGGQNNVADRTNCVHMNTLGDIYDATGLNIPLSGDTSALSIIAGIANLGVEVMTAFQPIVMEQGEEKVIVYHVEDENGVGVNCSGYTAKFGVKKNVDDASYQIGALAGELSADSGGIMALWKFKITTDTTKSMTPFAGKYSAAIYDGSGNKIRFTEPGGVAFTLKMAILTVL